MELHVTRKMTGKMKGMVSLNTTPLTNEKCMARSKIKGSVCEGCYSIRMMKLYPNASRVFDRNNEMLSRQIEEKEIPRFNSLYVRFSAHGEVETSQQLKNYIAICNANPKTTFTLWTKERAIVSKTLQQVKKPKNLILIYSSLMRNKKEQLPKSFDKVFTVYDKDKAEGKKINCNSSCIDCLLCYTKNRTVYVSEVMK